MKIRQIALARKALIDIGVNLLDGEFEELEIDVNSIGTPQLTFLHKYKNLMVIIEDPTNYPNRFEVKHLD